MDTDMHGVGEFLNIHWVVRSVCQLFPASWTLMKLSDCLLDALIAEQVTALCRY